MEVYGDRALVKLQTTIRAGTPSPVETDFGVIIRQEYVKQYLNRINGGGVDKRAG